MDTLFSRSTACIIVAGLLFLLSATSVWSQSSILDRATPTSDWPILVKFSPVPESQNNAAYTALDKKLELDGTGDRILIMELEMQNPKETSVSTTLKDIVVVDTNRKRYFFVAYIQQNLRQDAKTGQATYTLPEWETSLEIPPGELMTLHLVFIVEAGQRVQLGTSLHAYIAFTHESEIDNFSRSISIDRDVDLTPSVSAPGTQPLVPQSERYLPPRRSASGPPPISEELTQEKVYSLDYPTTPMSRGPESKFLDRFLGVRGMDPDLPYWIDIPFAVNDGFDYATAMELFEYVAGYLANTPDRLSRTIIWKPQPRQRILLAVTADHVYIATGTWGVISVHHDVTEVLLFVAQKAPQIGIDPSDVAPKLGTYVEKISENPGRYGFTIECTGVDVDVTLKGTRYAITLSNEPSEEPPEPKTRPDLIYNRRR